MRDLETRGDKMGKGRCRELRLHEERINTAMER